MKKRIKKNVPLTRNILIPKFYPSTIRFMEDVATSISHNHSMFIHVTKDLTLQTVFVFKFNSNFYVI